MVIVIRLTWNPSGDIPRKERSHPQFSKSPLEHARVKACATPALEMAWTNADSRVPEKIEIIIHMYPLKFIVKGAIHKVYPIFGPFLTYTNAYLQPISLYCNECFSIVISDV